MASISDVFNGDAFGIAWLTDAINNVPFLPGRAGIVAGWEEESVPTTTIMIEEKNGVLELINPTPRGGPGQTGMPESRTARNLTIPHYQFDDYFSADGVQNVRAFGQTSELEVLENRVNARLQMLVQQKLDPTLEYQRVGALKGLILNGDGSTLYNLFNEFGVTQETEVDFDLDNESPAIGVLRRKCAGVVRTITKNLGCGGDKPASANIVGPIFAECGDTFFDDLLAHPEVVSSYKGTPMASVLRDGYVTPKGAVYGTFEFGGIVWENYRGSIGTTSFIEPDECHIFPTGMPGLWRTVYAPADYEETVNRPGLPRYARQYPTPNGKGRNMEVQMNALNYCTCPKALIKGKRT